MSPGRTILVSLPLSEDINMSSGGPVHWKLGMSAPVYPFKVAVQVSWYNSPSVLLPDDVMEAERDAIGKAKDTN